MQNDVCILGDEPEVRRLGKRHDDLMALLDTVPGVKEHLEECRRLDDGSVRWRDIRRD